MLKNVVIVGGGTSGWLTATYLIKLFQKRNLDISLTLVESSDIGTIGVGEATIPTIIDTLQELELDEYEFMKSCSGTFKQAIKFVNWMQPNSDGTMHEFYHNFTEPMGGMESFFADYWVNKEGQYGQPYAYASSFQSQVCDLNLAPKRLEHKQFSGPLSYAYHFDAGLFAQHLKKVAKSLGVNHVIANVEDVVFDSDSSIISKLTLDTGEALPADLYIDCSGFNGLLIEKSLGSPFTSLNDQLFVDSAVACQVPYDNPNDEIKSYTTSTAQEAGWCWDIGLNDRRGTGYVYSSKYTDRQRAEEVLAEYLGRDKADCKFKHLNMRIGYRQEQWKGNCIAIGLSSGFLEPLESTGIYLVEIALRTLKELFSDNMDLKSTASQYNKLMVSQYVGAADFIKLHYVLTNRTDTEFWKDNCDPTTCSSELIDLLSRIKNRAPNVFDLPIGPQCFTIFSYFAVIYGMDCLPEANYGKSLEQWGIADSIPLRVDEVLKEAVKALPPHRELIKQIYDM